MGEGEGAGCWLQLGGANIGNSVTMIQLVTPRAPDTSPVTSGSDPRVAPDAVTLGNAQQVAKYTRGAQPLFMPQTAWVLLVL